MPRPNLMSWEGAPAFRWTKFVTGFKPFRVTCDELGMPRDKNLSLPAANEWWKKKSVEIAASKVTIEAHRAIANRTELIPVVTAKTAIELEKEIKGLQDGSLKADDVVSDPKRMMSEIGRAILNDRIRQQADKPKTDKDKTIGHNLDQFFKVIKPDQTLTSHHEIWDYLTKLTESGELWKATDDVNTITEDTVIAHYLNLSAKKFSPGAHNKRLGFFRRFVNWLYSSAKLDKLPRNINLKSDQKKRVHKIVKTFEDWEVRAALSTMNKRQKIWALLGLNCAMTNADLGQLTWDMIDKKTWTLTRRRVKTGHLEVIPTVTYKLFPEVVAMFQELDTKEGLVFLTERGTPMHAVFADPVTGKRKKKDNFSQTWNRDKPSINLDRFRSIGSNALENSPNDQFIHLVNYFLGHAPNDLNELHYTKKEQHDMFFKALEYIRLKYVA